MTRVLVTGASGFIGGAVLSRFAVEPGFAVRAAVRRQVALPPGVTAVSVGDLGAAVDWSTALRDVDVVVHCAARAHVVRENTADPLAAFRRVNVDGTLALAQQARDAGVKRFVFVSSVKVNGEATLPGRPFKVTDPPRPQDPYGASKWAAEQGLVRIAEGSPMEWVIVRPALVYGPGVKANFLALLRVVHAGVPLPLKNVRNRRSLIALDNLVDLIRACAIQPAAAGEVFLASDNECLSTSELLTRVGIAIGRPARLFYLPKAVLRTVATTLGKRGAFERLFGSLEVDASHARERLSWRPVISLDDALTVTAKHFLRSLRR